MPGKNYELELYKLVKEGELISECGWINNKQYCIWVDYINVYEFMGKSREIFGSYMFDDGGFGANMQDGYMCIDLCEMLGSYLSVEDVFPYCEENMH